MNNHTNGLYELTMQTLQLMELVLLSGYNVRLLEQRYFCPAIDYVLRNVPREQALNIVSRYNSLRTELINRRIASPDRLPAISSVNSF